ncbi:MAG: hypothetical protein WB709_08910 [Solirubrobacteraceae bacterium]
MARPWPKRSAWPYVGKHGRKSYTVGFYRHDKAESSRSFPTIRHARAWMDEYITAERRGPDSLRRFLLDLDAKEANQAETRTIGEILDAYLELNAHPSHQGGLAPSTYERYVSTVNRHLIGRSPAATPGGPRPPKRYALELAVLPAVRFNTPQAPRAWREQMMREGAPKPTRDHAWQVLSAALSWAASSALVPEIQTNGCALANEPRVNRRRSIRHGGTGYTPGGHRHGLGVLSWALSPLAVEAIRAQMLSRTDARRAILAQRDAMIVSLQYGLGARNQEIWGLRWQSLEGEFAWVLEVLSYGQLCEWGKTENSTQRRAAMPSILKEDLSQWRAALQAGGYPTRAYDFIIPGDLGGARYGVSDPRTGARHFSKNQAHSWGARFFTPAVNRVAEHHEFFAILGATPYALRRGGISLRLRAEDPQTVASECGTSLKMLSDHYAFAIEDLRENGPRPVDVEWRAARVAQAERRSHEETLRDVAERGGANGQRRSLLAWFSSRRRTSRAS